MIDHYRHRNKARIIAIIDMILSSMALAVAVILIFVAVTITVANNKTENENKKEGEEVFKNDVVQQSPEYVKFRQFPEYVWLIAFAFTTATLVQIVAAVKLLNATQLGKEASAAYQQCRYWRSITLFFTFLAIFSLIFDRRTFPGFAFLVCNILIRLTAVSYVQQFMNELRTTTAAVTVNGILPTHFQTGVLNPITEVSPPMYPPSYAPYDPNMYAPPPAYDEVVKTNKEDLPQA